MLIKNYLEQECLTFHSYEAAAAVQQILLNEGYCVMLAREECLWTLNWVWTETPADRNGVIFINRVEYECNEWEWIKQHPEYMKESDD